VVGDTLSVGEAEVDETGRLTMEPDLVGPVVVEIADEGMVARVAEEVGEVRRAEPASIGTELVDDVDPPFGRAVDTNRVAAVAVEVAGQGDVARVAEEEPDIGDAL
jgi:hypothetical protein